MGGTQVILSDTLAMTEKMDSRFRGNDIRNGGNDEGRRDCRASINRSSQ